MPYPDQRKRLQKSYKQPLKVVLVNLLNTVGWEGAAAEFGVAESTIGEWIRDYGIARECTYVLRESATPPAPGTEAARS